MLLQTNSLPTITKNIQSPFHLEFSIILRTLGKNKS